MHKINESVSDFESEGEQDTLVNARPKLNFKKLYDDPKKRVPYVIKYSNTKWLVLFIGSLITFGNWYCLDLMATMDIAITLVFKQEGKTLNYTDQGSLYTWLYFPNIIMPIITGLFIDRWGLRAVLIIMSAICMLGQLTIAIAASNWTSEASFQYMVVGRAIYGIGFVSLISSQLYFITDWFVGQNLSLAYAIAGSLPISAGPVNSFLSPLLFNSHNPKAAIKQGQPYDGFGQVFWMGLYLQVFSFVCTLIVVWIDLEAENQLKKVKKNWNRKSADADMVDVDRPKFRCSEIKNFGYMYWLNVLSASFQLVACRGFLTWVPIVYILRYQFSYEEAAFKISIPYTIQILASPVIGMIVDKYGHALTLTNISCLGILITYTGILINFNGEQIESDTCVQCSLSNLPLIIIGFTSATQNVINNGTIVQALVSENALGSAFGISQALQYSFLTFSPLLVGHLLDSSDDGAGLLNVFEFFLGVSAVATFFNIALTFVDFLAFGQILNQKQAYQSFDRERSSKQKVTLNRSTSKGSYQTETQCSSDSD